MNGCTSFCAQIKFEWQQRNFNELKVNFKIFCECYANGLVGSSNVAFPLLSFLFLLSFFFYLWEMFCGFDDKPDFKHFLFGFVVFFCEKCCGYKTVRTNTFLICRTSCVGECI